MGRLNDAWLLIVILAFIAVLFVAAYLQEQSRAIRRPVEPPKAEVTR